MVTLPLTVFAPWWGTQERSASVGYFVAVLEFLLILRCSGTESLAEQRLLLSLSFPPAEQSISWASKTWQ